MKKKFLSKLGIVLCALIVTTTSQNVFATDSNTTIEKNISIVNENDVMPLYVKPTDITVHNGQTVYFDNLETQQPFYIANNGRVTAIVGFSKAHEYFDFGLVDANNKIVLSTGFYTDNLITRMEYTWGKLVPQGRYRIYFTNYNVDPVTLTTFGIRVSYNKS